MRILPGPPPVARCAEPTALRELLRLLGMSPVQAAGVLGCTVVDVVALCQGTRHLDGTGAKWDTRRQRYVGGAWADVAEALCQSSPRTSPLTGSSAPEAPAAPTETETPETRQGPSDST